MLKDLIPVIPIYTFSAIGKMASDTPKQQWCWFNRIDRRWQIVLQTLPDRGVLATEKHPCTSPAWVHPCCYSEQYWYPVRSRSSTRDVYRNSIFINDTNVPNRWPRLWSFLWCSQYLYLWWLRRIWRQCHRYSPVLLQLHQRIVQRTTVDVAARIR